MLSCLAFFFDHPSFLSARLILHNVVPVLNSSHRKYAISSRYKWGFSNRWSQSAFTITGVRLRGRPPLFGGAFTPPNSRMLERILLIVRSLQQAASAILETVRSLLNIMSWMSCKVEAARLGAMMSCPTSWSTDLPEKRWNPQTKSWSYDQVYLIFLFLSSLRYSVVQWPINWDNLGCSLTMGDCNYLYECSRMDFTSTNYFYCHQPPIFMVSWYTR